jgi:hypothetical protein
LAEDSRHLKRVRSADAGAKLVLIAACDSECARMFCQRMCAGANHAQIVECVRARIATDTATALDNSTTLTTVQAPTTAPRTTAVHAICARVWPCHFTADADVERMVADKYFTEAQRRLIVDAAEICAQTTTPTCHIVDLDQLCVVGDSSLDMPPLVCARLDHAVMR